MNLRTKNKALKNFLRNFQKVRPLYAIFLVNIYIRHFLELLKNMKKEGRKNFERGHHCPPPPCPEASN